MTQCDPLAEAFRENETGSPAAAYDATFIGFLRRRHPPMWALIRRTADETGLIVVDEENDAVTATNRLLWTNPVLHDCLATLVEQWAQDAAAGDAAPAFRRLLTNESEESPHG